MSVNILVVEDEFIIAEDLQETLIQLGYKNIEYAANYADAIEHLKNKPFNIALLDVNLNDTKDGIDVAHFIKEHYQMPFIFVTSNADKGTIDRAKEVKPNGYIIKPFNKADIYSSIELALANYISTPKEDATKNTFFIKDGTTSVQLIWKEVIMIKSEANYIAIITSKKKYLIRKTLKEFAQTTPTHLFFQIHKSYIVNMQYIESIKANHIMINQQEIPIGREFKDSFLAIINKI